MKRIAVTLAMFAGATMAHAAFTLVPNGDFSSAGASWGNFASGGTVISFPATGGNSDGYGLVDNTAGAWGGGLVSPADFEYPGNDGIPLTTLGIAPGQTITVKMDMKNFSGDGLGGLKMEAWNANQGGPGVPGIIDNTGDVPASGQSSSWASYTWTYAVPAGATSLKFVPLLTPPSNNAGGNLQSSIGFDNVSFEVIPEPSSVTLLGLGLAGFMFRRRRN